MRSRGPKKKAARAKTKPPRAAAKSGRRSDGAAHLRTLTSERGEALAHQAATAEILRAITASPGEAESILRKIAETTARLFGAPGASLRIVDGDEFGLFIGVGRGAEEITRAIYEQRQTRMKVSARTLPATVVRENRIIHLPDLDHIPAEIADWPGPPVARKAGIRTMVGAPLRNQSRAIGALMVYRDKLKPFTERELEILQSFADQAAIAIENTRLLDEIRAARDAAEKALAELKTAQASLIHAEKMASLGQLTAGIAHEIKNPLNFVNNFAGLSVELLGELKAATARVVTALDSDIRGEIDETIEMLTGNLHKIGEHGRRADGIVKSMLAHSRGTSGERQKSDINALVEEALNLAYHGARAQDQDFNITLERDYAPAMSAIEVVPQEVTRVFLNLIGNSFHAARQRQKLANDTQFRPVLKVSTRDLGEAVEVRVRDNGTGIKPEHRDKLFQPFFTTKPTGEGTGLGLSISYEIITQQHGGTITVDSESGSFTEFTIRLPRRGQGKSAEKVA
jgi:signal transduction histidine kinase